MRVPRLLRWLPAAGALAAAPGCLPGAARTTAGAPAPLQVRFADVQEEAGIRFTHADGGSGKKYFIEQFCSGAGFVDFDNDGFLDVYAVNGAPLPGTRYQQRPRHQFWRNRGDGTFEDLTDRAGLGSTRFGGGICAGDFDNDGWTDLYVTNYGKNHLYRNLGNGRFEDVAERAGVAGKDGDLSTSAAFLDYDNDGLLDLYVCHYVKYDLAHDRWCGIGRTRKRYCGPEVFPPQFDSLYRNNGDGTFSDVSKAAGIRNPNSKSLGVTATDVNNDGWVDLYVACDLMPNLLFINRKNGTFRETGVSAGVAYSGDGAAEAGMGIAAGDYDNDGHMDLFVTNYSFEMNALYRNEGGGIFGYASETTGIGPPGLVHLGFGTRLFDADLDGWQDAVVANGHVLDDCAEQNSALEYAQVLQLFRNVEGRRFAEITRQAGPAFERKFVGRGLAIGDYDNDGDVDLLVSNNKGPLRLIRNGTRTPHQWLSLKLRGTKSNRDAIGARVTVTAGGKKQTQEVCSGSSYLSQSDFRLHFGLAGSDRADLVEVRWPGGKTETWSQLQAGKLHLLIEGKQGESS